MPRAQLGAQGSIRMEGEAPCRRTRFARGPWRIQTNQAAQKEIASLRRIIGGRAPVEAAGIEMRGHNRWLTDTERRRRGIGSVFTYIACGSGRTLPHMGRKPRQTVGIGVGLCQKLAKTRRAAGMCRFSSIFGIRPWILDQSPNRPAPAGTRRTRTPGSRPASGRHLRRRHPASKTRTARSTVSCPSG